MTTVDALASLPHYRDHLQPIFDSLPNRGAWNPPRPTGRYCLTASGRDYQKARRLGYQVIYCEHGAGQTYRRPDGRLLAHPSYAGSNRDGIVLYLSPGASCTSAILEGNPGARVVEIGCPRLAPYLSAAPPAPRGLPVIAFSFHWDCSVTLETRSAWREYLPHLQRLQSRYQLLGHAHPRITNVLRAQYAKVGIEFAPSFEVVLERASAYAVDNSSTLFEFALTGRPVIVLNSRAYRRDVRHGLRFWDAATIGEQVDHHEQLEAAIELALKDPPHQQQARHAALQQAYATTSTTRAVAAILDTIKGGSP